eukprot:SAG11_NODE_1176_length_5600_cov_8.953827_2_plen_80_part_00
MKVGNLYYRVEVDGDFVFGEYDDVCHYLKNLNKDKKCFICPGEETEKENGELMWRRLFNHNYYEQWDKSVRDALKYFRN